jgi:hypothetical protein
MTFELQANDEYLDGWNPEWEIRINRETCLYFDAPENMANQILQVLKEAFQNRRYIVYVQNKKFDDLKTSYNVAAEDLDDIYFNFPVMNWNVEILPA